MSAFDEYIEHGWQLCCIGAGEKGPSTPGWNLQGVPSVPAGMNAGLLHTLSNSCAVDIDDYVKARPWLLERGIVLDDLFNAPDAVQIISGRPNSGKLLFSMWLPLPSKKIIIDGVTVLELRSASASGASVQDVLPPSLHPSGSVYKWGGAGHWKALPALPNSLLTVWHSLLEADHKREVPAGEGMTPASFDEIKSALFSLSPDCSRRDWISIGMSLEAAGAAVGQEAAYFELFDSWSSGSKTKYDPRITRQQWRSFKPRKDGIGIGTLFRLAKLDGGWVRPTPDISSLFRPIGSQSKAEVLKIVSTRAWIPEQNLSLWPDILVRRATEVAAEVGCDVTVPLLAGLAAVSGAVDKRIKLRITDTWSVPPVFWAMTIGEPSDKKSPGCRPMFVPLKKLEHEDRPNHEAKMLTWIGKEAAYAAQSRAYREWAASPDAQLPNAVPPTVTPLEPQPEPLRLLVMDSTSQKLVHMSQNRPRGFLNYLDEMATFFKRVCDSRSTEDRGCWIQSYETGQYTMDRVGAGTIHTDNLAMSIVGNCQPEIFREYGSAAASDGLMQRFLPVMLNAEKNAMWQDSRPAFMSHAAEYEQLIRSTYALPIFEYSMTPEANDCFRAFCEWCIDFRKLERRNHASSTYQTALGKMEGQCGRLILLFHIIMEPHNMFISLQTVERAVNLLHKFFIPMMRYVYMEVVDDEQQVAKRLFDQLLQLAGIRPTVSLSDLRRLFSGHRAGRAGTVADDEIISIMLQFQQLGHVTVLSEGYKATTWTINPAIAEQFAEDRERVIRQKQALIDQLEKTITKRTGSEWKLHKAVGSMPETCAEEAPVA